MNRKIAESAPCRETPRTGRSGGWRTRTFPCGVINRVGNVENVARVRPTCPRCHISPAAACTGRRGLRPLPLDATRPPFPFHILYIFYTVKSPTLSTFSWSPRSFSLSNSTTLHGQKPLDPLPLLPLPPSPLFSVPLCLCASVLKSPPTPSTSSTFSTRLNLSHAETRRTQSGGIGRPNEF